MSQSGAAGARADGAGVNPVIAGGAPARSQDTQIAVTQAPPRGRPRRAGLRAGYVLARSELPLGTFHAGHQSGVRPHAGGDYYEPEFRKL